MLFHISSFVFLKFLWISSPILLCTDGPLARSLHHQPSSACPHSHGTPQLTSQPPAQGDYVIPHTVTFHPSLPSHPSGHAMTPAPPPPLSTHHLSGSGAALAQHLPTDHQTLPHHIPALGASVQRLHQHEMLQRMEVQRRRLMQHPTWASLLFTFSPVPNIMSISFKFASFFAYRRAHERPPPHPHRMHPNYGHGHHIHVPQTMSSHPRQPEQRTAWSVSGVAQPGSWGEVVICWWLNSCTVFIHRELGIETVAPYPPSGHLHSHLPAYHPPPRLHHFPFMVRVQPRAHTHTLA